VARSFAGSRAALVLLIALSACKQDEEVTYTQVNSSADSLEIIVGDEVLDSIEIDLTSSTGQVTIGWARVDPGGGPVGTEHELVVEVFDDYEDLVDRTSVRIAPEGRGEDEFDLDRDSADEGFYQKLLETNGDEDEARTDSLTFRLWDRDDDDDATASSGENTEDTGS
jgi:hypothetical protein